MAPSLNTDSTRARTSGSTFLVCLVASAFSCGRPALDPRAGTDVGDSPVCRYLGPLMDLRAGLRPIIGAGNGAPLIAVEHQVGAILAARPKLREGLGTELTSLDRDLDKLSSELIERSLELRKRIANLSATSEVVEKALDATATCQGVDMRVLEAPAGADRQARRKIALGMLTVDASENAKKNRATIDSKACASAARLWSAIGNLNTSEKTSIVAVSGHIAELHFDGERAKVRDELVAALKTHARALGEYEEYATKQDPARAAPERLAQSIDEMGNRCVSEMSRAPNEVIGGNNVPRQVALLVKPKIQVNGETTTGRSFGSGVLVHWRTRTGIEETRIVTNAHVLDGAWEAEIFTADSAEKHREAKDAPRLTATLLRVSSDDDIAVLRVKPNAAGLPARGLTFRLSPIREQEEVAAVGFPGIGAHPSFQVSKGAVSNVNFNGAEGALRTYVQHTAAIDPGNSGGPLLDREGRFLGMNTLKVFGREAVGLAIPTRRVQLALLRADDVPLFNAHHAAATCDAFIAALSMRFPPRRFVDRISYHLDPDQRSADARITAFRDAISGESDASMPEARSRAYAAVRARLEDDGGIRTMELCKDVKVGARPGEFGASFATRNGQHQMILRVEDGELRVTSID